MFLFSLAKVSFQWKGPFFLSFGVDQCSLNFYCDKDNDDPAYLVSAIILIRNMLQMTTAIAIEDVRREVKILRALTGHKNLVQFYDAYEDEDNVYVVME